MWVSMGTVSLASQLFQLQLSLVCVSLFPVDPVLTQLVSGSKAAFDFLIDKNTQNTLTLS